MHNQALVWNTDEHLQVTSLTARLRDLAGLGTVDRSISVGDLWGSTNRAGVAMGAHQWALEGESLSFETDVLGVPYCFELDPLCDASGSIVGVSGRARPRTAGLAHDALRAAEHAAGIGTWHEDLRTGTVMISDGLATLLGIDSHAKHVDIRRFDHPDDRDAVKAAIREQLRNGEHYTVDHRVLCAHSRVRTVRERARTVVDQRGIPVGRIGTLIDISDFKEREAELADLAHYDPLTRLPNRALLEERLEASVARCERHNVQCAVLFIDLDDFKTVNDTHGHDAGDRLLVAVGDRLTRQVRASDTVARLGGDEFVVVIDDLFSEEAAIDAARKILRGLDDPFFIGDAQIAISASVGIATYPRCGALASDLLSRADREMYVVKRNGGRGVKLAASIHEQESANVANEKAAWPTRSSPDLHPYAIPQSV